MKSYIIHPESEAFIEFQTMPGFSLADHSIDTEIERQYLLCGILVKDDNIVMARAAVYKNPYHGVDNSPSISIGYFESVNDLSVTKLLFNRIKNIAKLHECRGVIGPINGSTWKEHRYQIYGDQDPFFMEYRVPDFYHDLWVESGFDSLTIYRSDKIYLDQEQRKVNIKGYCERKEITIRNLEEANLSEEIKRIGALSLISFRDNYLYSPISLARFEQLYAKATKFIDPSKILIAEREGELVGFLFGVPNYLDQKEKGVIVKTLARNSDKEYQGLGSILSAKIVEIAIAEGYDYLINAYYHESNVSGNVSKKYNGQPYKKYELLQCAV